MVMVGESTTSGMVALVAQSQYLQDPRVSIFADKKELRVGTVSSELSTLRTV
jgi:hypothetical protein